PTNDKTTKQPNNKTTVLSGHFVVLWFSCLVDSQTLSEPYKRQNDKTTKQQNHSIVWSFCGLVVLLFS
ncbi:MAG: hypothetical protein MSA80_00020, partial [Prevotella sp.]|nr:hypothetical protein [Prevotella sp.]